MTYPFETENSCHFPYRHLTYEKELCSKLRSQMFYLWTFIAQQDLWQEAFDFLDENYDANIPIDLFFSDIPF